MVVPTARFARWVDNFVGRHGATEFEVGPGLRGVALDGSHFDARLPFARSYEGPGEPSAFARSAVAPPQWGILLARRGGFAVARMAGEQMVSSKVGQRHVQGRTKAGGQSQKRFARRRDNQARAAWEAAAQHAQVHLSDLSGPLVLGGDVDGLTTVVELAGLGQLVVHALGTVAGEPRRAALDEAVRDSLALTVQVHNA